MTIRLAVIGVGWAGSRHIEAIAELNEHARKHGEEPAIEVVALVDPDAAHLSEVAKRFGISNTSTSLDTVLNDPSIDAVSIASPHRHHIDAAVQATESGKHVAVEKPMAVTVDEADRMIAAADSAGVKLFVTEQVAYSPEVRRLAEILRTGEYIGEPTFAAVWAGFRAENYGYPGRREWLAQPAEGGTGTWVLHGVHTVAAIRAIFGEVRRVYCVESQTPSLGRDDIEGTMTCLFETVSGLNIQLVQSCETEFSPDRSGTTIYGTNGVVHSGRSGTTVTSKGLSEPLKLDIPGSDLSDYALEFHAFARWITHDEVPLTTGRHERGSLAVIQAGYESARTGKPIDLVEKFGAAP